MKNQYRIYSFLLLLAVLQGLPVAAKQYPFNFVGAYRQALERRQEAASNLYECMEDIADWLMDYRAEYAKFPEAGQEQKEVLDYFARVLMQNPYTATGIASAAEKKAPPVRFLNQSSLNELSLAQWRKTPPADWQAEPGTISILYDAEDRFLIWGAGADRRPIRHPHNQETAFALRKPVSPD